MKVKATNPDIVTLWERNSLHPNGEVFIAGSGVFEVGMIDAIRRKLALGELVEVKPLRRKKVTK